MVLKVQFETLTHMGRTCKPNTETLQLTGRLKPRNPFLLQVDSANHCANVLH